MRNSFSSTNPTGSLRRRPVHHAGHSCSAGPIYIRNDSGYRARFLRRIDARLRHHRRECRHGVSPIDHCRRKRFVYIPESGTRHIQGDHDGAGVSGSRVHQHSVACTSNRPHRWSDGGCNPERNRQRPGGCRCICGSTKRPLLFRRTTSAGREVHRSVRLWGRLPRRFPSLYSSQSTSPRVFDFNWASRHPTHSITRITPYQT